MFSTRIDFGAEDDEVIGHAGSGCNSAPFTHPANVQDRDGAEPLLRQVRRLFPGVERVIGDAGHQDQDGRGDVADGSAGVADRPPL